MASLDKIKSHPDFLGLSTEDQDKVVKNFISREWSNYANHPEYVKLADTDKEKVRAGYMQRYYGDALQPVDKQFNAKNEPLLADEAGYSRSSLIPPEGAQSVNAPIYPGEYPAIQKPEQPEQSLADQYNSPRSRPIPELTQGKGPEHYFSPGPQPERTAAGTAKDTAITAVKGSISIGEAIQGLIDIPTGGRFGYLTEKLGYKPKEAKEILDSFYSEAQKYANKEVDNAQGFTGTIEKMFQYPSTIAHTTLESLPMMGAGGVIGRGVMAVAPKVAPYVAGAIGEGIISGGSSAEQIRQQSKTGLITPKQSAMSLASGIGTGIFATVGGRLSNKLGFADIDTMLATGKFSNAASSIPKAIVSGGITEGLFEELPQSIQETIWMNAAQNKPLMEGVPASAAQGLVVGGVTGAGANLVTSLPATKEPVPVAKPTPTDILSSKNIDEAIGKYQQATVEPSSGGVNAITKTDNQEVPGQIEGTGLIGNGGRIGSAGNPPNYPGPARELGLLAPNETLLLDGELNGTIQQTGNQVQAIAKTDTANDTGGETGLLRAGTGGDTTAEAGSNVAEQEQITTESKLPSGIPEGAKLEGKVGDEYQWVLNGKSYWTKEAPILRRDY